jgi:proteasome lid subunit RPN8/RPN11
MNKANKIIAFEYAKSQLPREACGVLIIEHGMEVFVPCRNLNESLREFDLDPVDYAKAEDRGEVIEIFHSHPFGSARPSQVDKVAAEKTNLKWSIVSVPNGDWFEFEPSGYKAPLVGRSWAHGILDCYNLIQDYFSETLSIPLPDFERQKEWWHKGGNLYMENFEKAGFREVNLKEIKEHDVILFQIKSPVINHGGVYLGHCLFLHQLATRLSSRDVFGGYYQKNACRLMRHNTL